MSRLKFGIFLPPHHLPTYTNPTYSLQRDIDLIQQLDKMGYDEAWIGEHHSGGVEIIGDPLMFMAHLAAVTKHIRLGAGVVSLPYHNPLWVAERWAQLDHMSRGRCMLGLGPGALTSDAMMVGLQPEDQRDALEFDADVFMRLIQGDEPVSAQTPRYTLSEAILQLDWYSDPHPEIVAAAMVSPAGPRLAGTHGIGLLSIGGTLRAGVEVLAKHWGMVEARAAECGKKADRGAWRVLGMMHLAETKNQAQNDVRYGIREFCDYVQHTASISQFTVTGKTIEEYIEWALDSNSAIIGTWEEAVETIEGLNELTGGFGTYLLFDHNWANWQAKQKNYEIFADFVIPRFKKTTVRLQASEERLRRVREEFTARQATAVAAFTEKYEPQAAGKNS